MRFFQSFLPTYFFKCPQELNSYGPYPSLERKRKFHRSLELLFTFSIIRKIRHFHDVVVQTRQRNVEKKCDARAKLLFVQITGDMNTYLANESGFPSSTTTEDCALSLKSFSRGWSTSLWVDASPELEGFPPTFFNDNHPQASLKLKMSEFLLKNCREIFNNGNTIKEVKILPTFTQKNLFGAVVPLKCCCPLLFGLLFISPFMIHTWAIDSEPIRARRIIDNYLSGNGLRKQI